MGNNDKYVKFKKKIAIAMAVLKIMDSQLTNQNFCEEMYHIRKTAFDHISTDLAGLNIRRAALAEYF